MGGSSVLGYSGSATPITDLQVSGTGNPTVPVKLRVVSGSLSMLTTTGLTFTGSSSGSTLQFTGLLNNINTALATLRYTRSGTGSDTLEASLVNPGEVFFPDNNHLYEYVSYSANWVNARDNAATRVKYGATGYLVTVTSSAENAFVAERLLNAGWMGASDSTSENDWKWVTGPENGTSFWFGTSGGGPVSSRYSNWGSGEPNNSGDEDCAQFLTGGTGKWNDLPCTSFALPGYVVEYGSNESPIEISTLNVSITTQAANNYPSTPSSLGSTSYVNGSWGTNKSPSFNFTIADSDISDTLQYRIQIDNNSNFSSPEVDYTSALSTQGSKTFTVGQNPGSGSYNTGTQGQELSDGQYYWRIKATDNKAAESSYATANSGLVAFKIDTTDPTAAGLPEPGVDGLPSNNNIPSWEWSAGSDSGSGLAANYTLRWSQDSDLVTDVFTTTSSTNSFTHLTSLSEGTWYFQVITTDLVGNVSSSEVGNIIIDTQDPTIPSNLVIEEGSSTTILTPTINWDESTDINGLDPALSYYLRYSKDPSFGTSTLIELDTNSYTIPSGSSLTEGVWYFKARARDLASNESEYSLPVELLIDLTPPTIATNVISEITSNKRRPLLNWTASIDEGVGLKAQAYEIQWSTNENFSDNVQSDTTSTNFYLFTSDLSYARWYFRVRSVDALNNTSLFSTTSSIKIEAPIYTPTKTTIVETKESEIIPISKPSDIILNVFDEYTEGIGKKLELNKSQIIYFNVKQNEHTVTIKEGDSTFAIVTVASTPTDLLIKRGEIVEHDVDEDGDNDIRIEYIGMINNSYEFIFTELKPLTATVASLPESTNNNWLPLVCIVLIVLMVAYITYRKKRRSN